MKVINAHIYVIEFQKRNLSHVHILLIANSRDEFDENNIDDAIHAIILFKEIFEFNTLRKTLYELIVEQMIHKNCKKIEKALCHDFENRCIKWFLKKKLMMTNLCHHSDLSRYRRPSCEFVEKEYWNNKWMIFYNLWLLQKYEIHINVEICINAKLVKYLYKYIFKKSDHVDVFSNITTIRRVNELRANRQNNEKSVDEIKIFHDARWIEFCEIVWRILDFSFDEIKFAIIRFQLHLKNRNRIVINLNDKKTSDQLTENENFRTTQLIEYFELNRITHEIERNNEFFFFVIRKKNRDIVVNSRKHLYQNILEFFVWNKIKKIWIVRKMNKCVNRMYFMNFKSDDVFYLRLLLVNRKKCTSFDDLKIVNVQIEKTSVEKIVFRFLNYKQICVELELIDDDDEWNAIMIEIIEFDIATMLKKLFVTILIECDFAKSLKLWTKHKKM